MKYALLVHETPELAKRRKDPAFPAAGRAYGEALQAAGVFIGGAGLESSDTATTVSVRDGKRQVHDGPYPETKKFIRHISSGHRTPAGIDHEAGVFFYAPAVRQGPHAAQSP